MATLNAVDIVANELKIYRGQPNKAFPVTAFVFASPKVGDSGFKKVFDGLNDLRVLRIRNAHDIVPDYPFTVGIIWRRTCMESAGTQGSKGGFKLEADCNVALVNKSMDGLKDEYGVPGSWWCVQNNGMVQEANGSWKLIDNEVYGDFITLLQWN
ncbi:hypothetical protein RHSIM_Rhsim13G0185600 [Rhododendron simsii]|uniref:Phospholipase A1 n=1 Tax=Rhododendron simsii TaxID=118357 RepID=A0A834L7L5_RHOSS|nr:hypothetical protein RHSIM_Rhsim13G0185600 [Rhododendron simsii]